MTYYHGGIKGLRPGDLIVPSPPQVSDGCPVCVARSEGRIYTVGEYRVWLRSRGQHGESVLKMLEGASDYEPVDPPTSDNAVYFTPVIEYARWYAARSKGDLYEIQPVGEVTRSPQDSFETYKADTARVVRCVTQNVRLTRPERRSLMRMWQKADKAAIRS